jgi:hypothetical protein
MIYVRKSFISMLGRAGALRIGAFGWRPSVFGLPPGILAQHILLESESVLHSEFNLIPHVLSN